MLPNVSPNHQFQAELVGACTGYLANDSRRAGCNRLYRLQEACTRAQKQCRCRDVLCKVACITSTASKRLQAPGAARSSPSRLQAYQRSRNNHVCGYQPYRRSSRAGSGCAASQAGAADALVVVLLGNVGASREQHSSATWQRPWHASVLLTGPVSVSL